MKNIIWIIFITTMFSCSKNNGRETVQNKTEFIFSVIDTLIIDSGDEILYLGYGANFTEFDKNTQFLYNYNQRDNSIEVIDLDQLKLIDKIKFETEGPNGTGSSIQNLIFKGEYNILLAEYHQIHLFNTHAEKIATYKINDQNYKGDTLLDNESLSTGGLMDNTGEYFITTYSQGFGEPLGIAKIRLKDFMLQKIPIPGLKDLAKFRVSFSDGSSKSASHPGIFFHLQDDKVLVSSSAVNEIFSLNLKNDSIHHYSFNSLITPNSQKENTRINVGSQEEFQKLTSERTKDISFARFTYDVQNNRYYRFSQIFEKETPEGNIYKPVLTIFDKDLNQVFETDELPTEKMVWKYFSKNGKLYLYENVMDEMGFIVMEIEEL